MTGSAPVPVPITSRRHFHGICSSTDSGVCPKVSRNFLDAFFLRLRTVPRSVTTSCSWVMPSMRIEPNENFSKRMGTSGDHGSRAGCRTEGHYSPSRTSGFQCRTYSFYPDSDLFPHVVMGVGIEEGRNALA